MLWLTKPEKELGHVLFSLSFFHIISLLCKLQRPTRVRAELKWISCWLELNYRLDEQRKWPVVMAYRNGQYDDDSERTGSPSLFLWWITWELVDEGIFFYFFHDTGELLWDKTCNFSIETTALQVAFFNIAVYVFFFFYTRFTGREKYL